MAKFKMKLKLQGLELEIEGNREDIPLINQAIGNQVTGLLKPANDIVEGEIVPENTPQIPASVGDTAKSTTKKRSKSKKLRPQQASNSEDAKPLAWKHNIEKWGTPRNEWSSAEKSIWLLYVASQEANVKELTTGQIGKAFNMLFKPASPLVHSNIARDLHNMMQKPNSPIAEDTSKEPNTWYLTTAGNKMAEQLIQKALGNGDSK